MRVPVGLTRQHPKLELMFSGGEGGLLAIGTTEAKLARAFYEEHGMYMTVLVEVCWVLPSPIWGFSKLRTHQIYFFKALILRVMRANKSYL